MTNKIIFGTSNVNKIKEIKEILPEWLQIQSMKEANIHTELPEDQDTIEGNAIQKVQHLYALAKTNCFAEDTGLEITALDGKPGVYSARYAGSSRNPQANMEKVLQQMQAIKDRQAQFRTVIGLYWMGELHTFEGIVKGRIAKEVRGVEGFGYDPIFIPDGFTESFGQLPPSVKNKISHRSRAMNLLVAYLWKQQSR